MQLHHRIWTDIDNPLNKERPTFKDIMLVVRDVKRKMPFWLVYDIESTMSNDIFKLLKTQLRQRAL